MDEFDRKNIIDRRGDDHPILVQEERRSGKDRRAKRSLAEKMKIRLSAFLRIFRR